MHPKAMGTLANQIAEACTNGGAPAFAPALPSFS